MLEGEKYVLQGLPLTLPHVSPLKHGHKGVFWLTLLQVSPKNPFQKGFALYQGPWLALSIWQRLGTTWDTSLWVCLWGIVFTKLTEVGGPAHCGWHHSLTWNPRLDKWRKGAEQQQTPFCASRPWVGGEQLCQVLLPWLPTMMGYWPAHHDGLLTRGARINLSLLSFFHQNISWQQQEEKARSVPCALLLPCPHHVFIQSSNSAAYCLFREILYKLIWFSQGL